MSEPEQTWLQMKNDSQRRRILKLEETLAASKNPKLAHKYVAMKSAFHSLVNTINRGEKSYTLGFKDGFFDGYKMAKAGVEMDLP